MRKLFYFLPGLWMSVILLNCGRSSESADHPPNGVSQIKTTAEHGWRVDRTFLHLQLSQRNRVTIEKRANEIARRGFDATIPEIDGSSLQIFRENEMNLKFTFFTVDRQRYVIQMSRVLGDPVFKGTLYAFETPITIRCLPSDSNSDCDPSVNAMIEFFGRNNLQSAKLFILQVTPLSGAVCGNDNLLTFNKITGHLYISVLFGPEGLRAFDHIALELPWTYVDLYFPVEKNRLNLTWNADDSKSRRWFFQRRVKLASDVEITNGQLQFSAFVDDGNKFSFGIVKLNSKQAIRYGEIF